MKYVALLRGINVGGNSKIAMSDLKTIFSEMGFSKVATYINSGNVIFETDDTNGEILARSIETAILKKINLPIKIVIFSEEQLEKVIEGIPESWKKKEDMRCYVSFIISPTTVDMAFDEVDIKEGIDFLDKGPGVLYMGTTLSGLTKSSFTKLIGKKIYKEMTMRNLNTVRKILSLMEHY